MKITINGNLRNCISEFYLQTFSMLFFPEDNIFGKNSVSGNTIEVCVEMLSEDYMNVKSSKNKNEIDISVKICYNKVAGEKFFKCAVSSDNIDDNSHFKKELLIETGRAFFITASELTGIKPPWGIYTGIRPAKTAGSILEICGDIQTAISIMHEKYLIDEKKSKIAADIYINAKNIISGKTVNHEAHDREFSLYISIPFCPSRCKYCSFVSYSTSKLLKLIPQYIQKLLEELKNIGKIVREKELILRTVYIGGGTPTILNCDQLRLIFEEVQRIFDLTDIAEYTVEAGRPDTITSEKLAMFNEYGVDRISINPQTLNDDILKKIGRQHTSEDFFNAYASARKNGIKNINADCIIGLADETDISMIRTVEKLIELKPENITVHTLCVKRSSELKTDGSVIYKPYAPEINQALEQIYVSLYKDSYLPYYMYKQKYSVGNLENTGFGKKNHECLYNIYMMDELHTIFGAGAGATTKIVYQDGRIERRINNKYPYEYLKNELT